MLGSGGGVFDRHQKSSWGSLWLCQRQGSTRSMCSAKIAPFTRCADPSQSSQAPVLAAEPRTGLRASKFRNFQRLIFLDAGRETSSKQGLSHRQICQCLFLQAAVGRSQHSASTLGKGSLHTAVINTWDKMLPKHPFPHGDTECCFLYPSLLQRCCQLVIKEEQLALVRVESSLQRPQKPMKNRSPFFHWILDQIQRDPMV